VELKYYPDRVLRKKTRPIQEVNDDVMERARQMLEVMYEAEGVGLAGPQVGWGRRIVTIDVEGAKPQDRVFVNPIIVRRDGKTEQEEGCLSLPGIKVKVPRAEKLTVVAYTLAGERVEFDFEGLPACVWQHELDHLNGVLIIDKLPPTTLITIREQLKQLEEQVKKAQDQEA
jgi:peptide deformylase